MKIELHLMTPLIEDDDEFNQLYDFDIGIIEDDKVQFTIFYKNHIFVNNHLQAKH